MAQPQGSIAQPAPVTKATNRMPLYMLFVANVISYSGNIMALIAIPWFVLQTTGSASKTGIAAFFTALPLVLAAFFGGVLVDRLGYKRTSIIADLASGVAIVMIPLLYRFGGLQFWQLLVIVFVGNLLDAPGGTARQAIVPELAELAGMPLERASALSDAVARSTRLIGGPLAGVLIAAIGTDNVLWLDGLSFLISAGIVALAIPNPAVKLAADQASRYVEQLVEGVQFIRRSALIMSLISVVMITNLLDSSLSSVVLPVYVEKIFNSPVPLGVMMATLGGAAVLGTIWMSTVGYKLPRRPLFTIGYILVSFRFFVLAAFPSLPVILIMQALVGLAVSPVNPIMSTVIYERIPVEMRARVLGAVTAGVLVAIPLGVLVSGYLLDWIGLQATLLLLGVGYLGATLSLAINPAIRELDKPAT
jgi:MFS family permease